MVKLLRANIWWNTIVPQVLGWIYFCALTGLISLNQNWRKAIFFFIAMVCIAAFGFLFNDLMDQESDQISGKENLLAGKNIVSKMLWVSIPFTCGIISWYFVQADLTGNLLFVFQIIALLLYSIPPIRFKNRPLAGIITDAFYGHINPVLIALFTFNFSWKSSALSLSLLATLFICSSLKGMRNILLHQLHDRKKDQIAHIQTFVIKNGALFSLRLVNAIIPFEIAFTFLLAILISVYLPSFFLAILFFGLITYLKFSGWKLWYLPKRQLKFKFLFFLNDYYENWMPVFLVFLLGLHQNALLFLLLLHLILFPAFLTGLWGDLKMIKKNFETIDDY